MAIVSTLRASDGLAGRRRTTTTFGTHCLWQPTSCYVNWKLQAVDRSDVTLNDGSVTISLPVSKTDWEAKGMQEDLGLCLRQEHTMSISCSAAALSTV